MRSIIKRKPLLIFIVTLIILYLMIDVIPRATGALRSSYTVEYGELQTYDRCPAYIIRNEKVYTAGVGGEANRYMTQDKLIRKGIRVMEVKGNKDGGRDQKYSNALKKLGKSVVETKNFQTRAEGLVSWKIDGFESYITPGNMEKKSIDEYNNLNSAAIMDLRRDRISKSDPVFKIVDRSAWYAVMYIDKDHKNRYNEGQKLKLVVGDSALVGRVRSIKTENNKVRLIIKSNYYYSGLTCDRVKIIKSVTSDNRGLIIRNSSITKKDGKTGVYVRQKNGGYEFTRISILSADDEYSVIRRNTFVDGKGVAVKTVRNYDEVLRHG